MRDDRGKEHANYTSAVGIAGRRSIEIFVWPEFSEQFASIVAAWVGAISKTCSPRGGREK
jgi:hypothetical protein